MQAVKEGRNAPPEYPPHFKRPKNSILDRIETLQEWRKLTGRDLGVPSDVVLPRDVLTRIAWADPGNMKELEAQMQDVPYRFSRFGHEILQVVQKGEH